jgi:glycosyltransferase involved in cell wall biosynthesis
MQGEDDLIKHPPVIMFLAKTFQRDTRVRQEARALVDSKYAVHVICWDRELEFPSGTCDGALVHSFKFAGGERSLGLVLGAFLFQGLAFFESLKLVRRLGQQVVLHAHDFNALLPAILFKLLYPSSRLIYDCHEVTYDVYSIWFNPVVGGMVRVLEERFLRSADAVITVTDPIAGYLRRFCHATEVIYNCPRMADIPKISKEEARIRLGLPRNLFIVSWVGEIRRTCRMDLLLSAASLVDESVVFIVVGSGPLADEFRQTAERSKGSRVMIIPYQPHEKALLYVAASDLTWVIYRDAKVSSLSNVQVALPWKLFESLACGIPVIVDADAFQAELVREHKCGIVLESDNPIYVSQAIMSIARNQILYQRMSEAARAVSTSFGYNWEAMTVKLISVYDRLRQGN